MSSPTEGAAVTALDIMDRLRACLCDQLELIDGKPCFCGLYPGDVAYADFCSCMGTGSGCGMSWVRLDRIYPSSKAFPAPDITATPCTSSLAAVIEVGAYRCQPVASPSGAPPDEVAQANAVLQQLADFQAMQQAFACCEAVTERDHLLGTYVPRNAGGACGGGVWPITVRLNRVA